MDAERYAKIDALFQEARRLKPQEREAYLNEKCGGDPTLRFEVEALLTGTVAVNGPASLPDLERIPERIGSYKILEVLGEGGMGIVYLAEQKEPIHRRVALKVIRLGMDTREVVGRSLRLHRERSGMPEVRGAPAEADPRAVSQRKADPRMKSSTR